jgi:hypothetical protein
MPALCPPSDLSPTSGRTGNMADVNRPFNPVTKSAKPFVFAFDDSDLPLPGKVQPQQLSQHHREHFDAPFFDGSGPESADYWP